MSDVYESEDEAGEHLHNYTHTKNSGHPEGSCCEHPCLHNNTIIKMRGRFESFAKSVFVFILKEKSLKLQIN